MRRSLLALALVLGLAGPALGNNIKVQLSSTTCPGSGCAKATTNGNFSVSVQIEGTWTGTLQFEATSDGQTFRAIGLGASSTGVLASSTTANGLWTGTVGGLYQVRVRASALSSGLPTVTVRFGTASVAGPADFLCQATVTLDNDQIKALPSTPLILAASSGSDFIFLPTFVAFIPNTPTTGYAGIGPTDYFTVGTGNDGQELIGDKAIAGDLLSVGSPALGALGFNFTSALSGAIVLRDLGALLGEDLTLSLSSSGTDYTGGDPVNKLTVSVAYLVLNTSTGVFV